MVTHEEKETLTQAALKRIVVYTVRDKKSNTTMSTTCKQYLPSRKDLPNCWKDPHVHKYQAGHVLVLGGSQAYTGAPVLAALGALRSGAGLVTLGMPANLHHGTAQWPEIINLPLGKGKYWSKESLPALHKFLPRLQKASALVMGPGLGRNAQEYEHLHALIKTVLEQKERPPVVLDADALFHFAHPVKEQEVNNEEAQTNKQPSPPALSLTLLRETDIITPHAGEMAYLLGWTSADVQKQRTKALASCVDTCAAAVLLKGAHSLVAQQKSPIIRAPFALPVLATAGSGDVLAGLCGALLAQGLPALNALTLAVHIHGRAGQLLHNKGYIRGALAQEIAQHIPLAVSQL